jgi:hypothetical protein
MGTMERTKAIVGIFSVTLFYLAVQLMFISHMASLL